MGLLYVFNLRETDKFQDLFCPYLLCIFLCVFNIYYISLYSVKEKSQALHERCIRGTVFSFSREVSEETGTSFSLLIHVHRKGFKSFFVTFIKRNPLSFYLINLRNRSQTSKRTGIGPYILSPLMSLGNQKTHSVSETFRLIIKGSFQRYIVCVFVYSMHF